MSLEALLEPWTAARILCHDDDVLAVDKPSRVPVHGGEARLADDVVGRLGAYLRARGEDPYLGVHQRLDKAASGALVFVRRPELNARIAAEVAGHRADREYLAVISGALPTGREGVLEDRVVVRSDGTTRVVRRGGRPARARYRVVRQAGGRALIALWPETGRTHQLRVQLSSRGAPIAGDDLYGGAPAPRLMLHATRLALASIGRSFQAPPPPSFEAALSGCAPPLGSLAGLRRALIDAGCLRYGLRSRADAFRLADGAADELPGVVVDAYGPFAVLTVTSDETDARRAELARLLCDLGARGVYLKARRRADPRKVAVRDVAPSEPIAGEPAPQRLVVREGQLRAFVRLGEGLSTGLFLDQRDNRERVMAMASGLRVLNLFAYTCSFTVAAALGGASSSVSVDLSAPALSQGRENLELNGVASPRHRLVRDDVLRWLPRARRRGERFDLVVLDPPSFATRGKGTFTLPGGYVEAAREALGLLAPEGRLLAVTNHRKTTLAELRRLLRHAARDAGRAVIRMKDLATPLDHPDRPGGAAPVKSVLVTVA